MKKRVALVLVLVVSTLFLTTFVSAGWWSDLFGGGESAGEGELANVNPSDMNYALSGIASINDLGTVYPSWINSNPEYINDGDSTTSQGVLSYGKDVYRNWVETTIHYEAVVDIGSPKTLDKIKYLRTNVVPASMASHEKTYIFSNGQWNLINNRGFLSGTGTETITGTWNDVESIKVEFYLATGWFDNDLYASSYIYELEAWGPARTPVTCTDSDGGKNYDVKGSTTGLAGDDTLTTDMDFCRDSNSLVEWFCSGQYRINTNYQCQNGCQDGACIQSNVTTPCTDSDGGMVPYKKGVTCQGENCEEDFCLDQNKLFEMDCGIDGNQKTGYQYECLIGCQDGKCIEIPNASSCINNFCTLQEGESMTKIINGKSYDISIHTISSSIILNINGVLTNSFTTGESQIIGDIKIKIKEIMYAAKDTVMSKVVFMIEPVSGLTTTCTDSDGGIDYYVKGITKGMEKTIVNGNDVYNYAEREDICVKDNQVPNPGLEEGVFEYYCENNVLKVKDGLYATYICPNGCQDGACIQSNVSTIKDIYVAYDLSAPVSDMIIAINIQQWLKDSKGIQALILKSNELTSNLDDKVIVYVFKGKSLVIIGDSASVPKVLLGTDIQQYLETSTDLIVCPIIKNSELIGLDFKDSLCNAPIICTDSDGGRNYNVKGYTYGDLSPFGTRYENKIGEVYDFCVQLDENKKYPWVDGVPGDDAWNRHEVLSCTENCAIYEMSCENGIIWATVPYCPKGCENGACIDVNQKICEPRYYCQTKPNICPSNGIQTKRCEDVECGQESYEQEVICNPGQCAGCEFEGGCIPYGFRKKVTLYEDDPGDYKLYCDMNGRLQEQKSDWRECQNSYECDSNLCSGGECTGINQMIKNISKFKELGIRIMCKLGHLFNIEEYQDCVANRLERTLAPTPGGGGSSGGSTPQLPALPN